MREFIQAIASYKLIPYLSPEDKVSENYLVCLVLAAGRSGSGRKVIML